MSIKKISERVDIVFLVSKFEELGEGKIVRCVKSAFAGRNDGCEKLRSPVHGGDKG